MSTARFVVCSRTEEYTAAAKPLRVEEAIELQPPTRKQVSGYLEAVGDALADVRDALDDDQTLWEFLASPLVLNIVALTYQNRPADALRETGTPEQRLAALFSAYFERMFEHRPGHYTPAQMLPWLAWLARSMRERGQTEFHLDRLQRDWLPTRAQQRLVTLVPAISVGLVFGLGGLGGGLFFGLIFGLSAGLAFGLAFGLAEVQPAEEVRWSWPSLRGALRSVLVVGLFFGLVGGLVFGLVSGLVGGLFFGLVSGLILGLILGLVYGGLACLQHLVIRGLLAWNGFAPLPYVRFLDEATERLFLRRAGSGYLFVHRLLLEHFADLDATGQGSLRSVPEAYV